MVLAAGGGSRYGAPKVLADGGAWLRAAVDALVGGGCADILVVLGAADADVPAPARSVGNPDWATGMASSVRVALAELDRTDADLALLHLVDLPGVGAGVVRRVLAAAQGARAGSGEPSLARATYDGRPGHPVVVPRRLWREMAAYTRGDQGGRGWLAGRSDLLLVPCEDLSDGRDRDYAKGDE